MKTIATSKCEPQTSKGTIDLVLGSSFGSSGLCCVKARGTLWRFFKPRRQSAVLLIGFQDDD